MKTNPFLFSLLFVLNLLIIEDVQAQVQNESQLIERISKTSKETDKFQLELELFQLYLTSDLEKAKRKLTELKSRKNKELLALAGLAELKYYLQIKDFSSFQKINNSLTLLAFKTIPSKIEYLTILGAFIRENQDFKKALILHNQALSLSKKVRNNYLSAEVYRNIGLDYAFQDKKDSALFYSNRSITLARKTNAQSGILTECFNSQALIYRYFNQIDIGIAKIFWL